MARSCGIRLGPRRFELVVLDGGPKKHRIVGWHAETFEDPDPANVEARGKQMVFVVNAATARARITSEAAIALSQHGTVAPTVVHQRVDFAASMIDGRTVMEIEPEGRSAREISQLWNYLHERLQRADGAYASPGEEALRAPAPVLTPFGRRAFGRRAVQ